MSDGEEGRRESDGENGTRDTTDARDRGFEGFLDALAAGEGYYLECPDGHGWLPPRRVCPACGSRDLERAPLPETGTVETHTTITVPTPRFEGDAPYATAIAAFGTVNVTGVIRGIDPADVETGLTVVIGVEETAATDERVVVFRPR